MTENKHIGTDFDDFLKEEGIYDEVKESTRLRMVERYGDLQFALTLLKCYIEYVEFQESPGIEAVTTASKQLIAKHTGE